MPDNIMLKGTGMIPHGLLVKLQAVYGTLKTAEKKAADLLLEKPKFFSEASIVEAASVAGCSEATLVRLSKKLGYAGYPDLKERLGRNAEPDVTALYEEIAEGDSAVQVVQKVFQSSIQALADTLNVLVKEEYEKAVDAIAKSKKLVFCGVGDAASVAQSGYQKFFRLGLNVQASADPDLQLIAASHLAVGDVLLAISYSGRTSSIVDVVKYARNCGATVIAITNFPISPLAKNSDIVLLTATFAEHVKGEVISKRVAELCMIESLFVNVLIRQEDRFVKELTRSNLALEINKL
jgi:RpiR family transcriptional regulator, carbohydrate utilization regulator